MPIDEPDIPVEMYLREMGSIQPLTSEEQNALFRQLGSSGKWNDEQENAAKRIIESQLPLVVRIARGYSSTGLPMLDMIQEGNLGLLRAVKHYAEQPKVIFLLLRHHRLKTLSQRLCANQNEHPSLFSWR